MRDQFSWRIHPSEDDFDKFWENAVFAFDANVLLNLYRVSESTTQDILQTVRALEERIYLPHRVAEEFFDNRRTVIRAQKDSFENARSKIEGWKNKTRDLSGLRSELGEAGRIMSNELDFLFGEGENSLDGQGGIASAVDRVAESLLRRVEKLEREFAPSNSNKATPDLDPILKRLLDTFEGHTGSPLTEDDIADGELDVVGRHNQIPKKVREQAKKRYENEIPPGYEDADKEGPECFGDYVIWRQILQYAEKADTSVVLVTGDKKPDWWTMHGGNLLGPRPELRQEFWKKTGKKFWMYSLTDFLSKGSERFGIDVESRSLTQTEEATDGTDQGFPWEKLIEGVTATAMTLGATSAMGSLSEIRADIEASISEGDLHPLPELTDSLDACLTTVDMACKDDRFAQYSREAREISRKVERDVENGWLTRAEKDAQEAIRVVNEALREYNVADDQNLLSKDLNRLAPSEGEKNEN